MIRTLLASSLLAVLALVAPTNGPAAAAASGSAGKIKIATLAPRGSETERNFKKINKMLKSATDGKWSIQFFPSGVAGDEKDVIRKMRIGQMDATIITTTGLSQIVREVAVLDAPGVINGYPQLDRVKAALKDDFQQTFASKGTRLLGWGEAGEYRYFTNKPLKRIGDLKGMRPWLWPSSYVLKEIFQTVGATGVPLGVPEVYGALQTNMVDAVTNTAVGASGLQWWSKVKYVTEETTGVLMMGVIMTDKQWEKLPPEVQTILQEEVNKATMQNSGSMRKDDRLTYKKLVKRGLTAVPWDAAAKQEYEQMAAQVRSRLVGRIYPKELLEKVQKVANGG